MDQIACTIKLTLKTDFFLFLSVHMTKMTRVVFCNVYLFPLVQSICIFSLQTGNRYTSTQTRHTYRTRMGNRFYSRRAKRKILHNETFFPRLISK